MADKNPVGRPPKYKTADDLQKQITQYFKNGFEYRTIVTKTGQTIKMPVITITGLVLYCGFCDRRSFYDLENQEKFSYTIKRARTFIEREYEQLLHVGSTTAIFALKNFDWKDKQEIDQTVKHQLDLKSLLSE